MSASALFHLPLPPSPSPASCHWLSAAAAPARFATRASQRKERTQNNNTLPSIQNINPVAQLTKTKSPHPAAQARRLEAAGRLPNRARFYRGLQDAREALALQRGRGLLLQSDADGLGGAMEGIVGAGGAGGGAEGGSADGDGEAGGAGAGAFTTLREAAAARAARNANAANALPRCQACEACTHFTGAAHRRRCLVMRAAAAAAGGHAGAQLAVMGEAAIGARVSVWWPMDGAWFEGVVS